MNRIGKNIANRGFTLLEVLMAIVISAVVLSFLGLSLIAATRTNTTAENRNRATDLAEEKIEDLRRLAFDDVVAGSDSTGDFSRVWTVTDNMGKPRSKEIEVTVSWKGSKGNTKSVVFNTTFYRNAYPYR